MLLVFRWFGLLGVLAFAPLACADTWLSIDTESLTLQVMDAKREILRIERISIGQGGAARDRVLGDGKTPTGQFRVAWLNPQSRFHFFIGLDYPRREHIERAHQLGHIDQATRERLLASIYDSKKVAQNTPLGGQIGIHGLGKANPRLHEIANWTEGCIAVTNEQIDQIRRHVKIGTPVLIR
jgi:murein L,D-transpeptidase YafK